MASRFSPVQSAFATAPGQPRDEIAVCLCPLSKVIGNPLQIHQGSGMAWGTCPANQCNALSQRSRLNRFDLASTCQKKVEPQQSTSWF